LSRAYLDVGCGGTWGIPVNYKAIETPASFITQGNTASPISLFLVVSCGGSFAIHKCAAFCCKSCPLSCISLREKLPKDTPL